MIVASAPGKLFIAGEYAVVEPGEPAVLVAIDRELGVRVEAHGAAPGRGDADAATVRPCRIRSAAYADEALEWRRDDAGRIRADSPAAEGDFALAAIRIVDRLRAERSLPALALDLHLESDLDDASGAKLGLGSSGAVAVAVVDAVTRAHGLELDRLLVSRLALLATIGIAPNASGGDVAASAFGGWIRYSSPDRAKLAADLERGVEAALASEGWARSSVTPLPTPRGVRLLVGWTGAPASTRELVARAHDGRDGRDASARERFLAESRAAVEALVEAIEASAEAGDDGAGDAPAAGELGASAERDAPRRILAAVRASRDALARYADDAGLELETPALRALREAAEQAGAAAKLSGAGGGDCGIAVADAGSDVDGMRAAWERAGVRDLGAGVSIRRCAATRPAGGAGDRPAGGAGDRPAGGAGDRPAGGAEDRPSGGGGDA